MLPVAINLDVLRPLMKDKIVSNLDDTLVITIKRTGEVMKILMSTNLV